MPVTKSGALNVWKSILEHALNPSPSANKSADRNPEERDFIAKLPTPSFNPNSSEPNFFRPELFQPHSTINPQFCATIMAAATTLIAGFSRLFTRSLHDRNP